MPMVLRPRKSIRYGNAGEVDSLDTTDTESLGTAESDPPDVPHPAAPSRSTRPPSRAAHEESDESDPECVQGRLMEPQGPPAELQKEAAEEAPVSELKLCSVVLDRLHVDSKAARKEPDDKDDMNRRGVKPVSRIPTFHKRPAGASQTPELPAPKKDAAAHGAPPPERAGSVSGEASKAKSSDTRDTALPLPSVRTPRLGYEAPSPFSGTDPQIIAPKSWPEPEAEAEPYYPTVTPRPALRPPDVLERDQSQVFDAVQDAPASRLPDDGYICQQAAAEEECDAEGRSTISLLLTAEVNQEDAIMDEQPPWEAEPSDTLQSKDSGSSSDSECEDKQVDDKSEGHESAKEEEENHRPIISEFSEVGQERETVEAEKPSEAEAAAQPKRSGWSAFALLCFLSSSLLLLGGLSHHAWLYGLPVSLAQLSAQLELHMLEGFSLVPEPCSTDCRVRLVESIPEGLYPSSAASGRSIASSWLHLLDRANSSVHIAAFYFTLRGDDVADSSDSQGREVFERLKQLGAKGVKLQLAVNAPQTSTKDTQELAAAGAEVREVDLQALTGGIVHTKLWVVDQRHLYLGSANMDWRSLTQVKEVGLSVEDCSCLAQDAFRIFGVYWSVGGSNASLPPYWPARLSALSSSQNPLRLKLNGVPAQVYLSSAPPQISTRGRTDDLAAILSVIDDAQKFVHISVMDYLPLSQFTEPLRFWPPIDAALRAAACTRGVEVRLLVSCWRHSPAAMFPFLQSLLVLSRPQLKCDVDVRIFTVPSTAEQLKIPFARVNHAKYMVTDRAVYIGTSNWSENYFTQTAGVGLVVNQTSSVVDGGQETLQSQAEELFLRDWRSEYSSPVSVDDEDTCPRGGAP